MARVLLTGGTGFIGRHCLTELLRSGHEVHAISRGECVPKSGVVHWHQADLFDEIAVSSVIEEVKPDALLHLAWEATPGLFWNSDENVRWVQATLSLLRAYSGVGGGRVVIAGSCAEYDWRGRTFNESTTPLAPASLYGTCKAALFRIVESVAEQWNLSLAWGRVFFLYGPGEPHERLVPSVIRKLINGEAAPCTHGNQIRDYLYVEDVARAFVAILESDVYGAVNIGSGIPVALREIVLEIGRQANRPDLINLGSLPERFNEPPYIVASTLRLTEEVKWNPTTSMQGGLERSVSWIRESNRRHGLVRR